MPSAFFTRKSQNDILNRNEVDFMAECTECGKLTNRYVNSVPLCQECDEALWQARLREQENSIKDAASFKEWRMNDMSELFWMHLGLWQKEPSRKSLTIMKCAYLWAVHANKGLANSFLHALKWAGIKNIETEIIKWDREHSKIQKIHWYELCFFGDEDPAGKNYDPEKACSYVIKTEIPPVIDDAAALKILLGENPVGRKKELLENLTCIMEISECDAKFFDIEDLTTKVESPYGTYYRRPDAEKGTSGSSRLPRA